MQVDRKCREGFMLAAASNIRVLSMATLSSNCFHWCFHKAHYARPIQIPPFRFQSLSRFGWGGEGSIYPSDFCHHHEHVLGHGDVPGHLSQLWRYPGHGVDGDGLFFIKAWMFFESNLLHVAEKPECSTGHPVTTSSFPGTPLAGDCKVITGHGYALPRGAQSASASRVLGFHLAGAGAHKIYHEWWV